MSSYQLSLDHHPNLATPDLALPDPATVEAALQQALLEWQQPASTQSPLQQLCCFRRLLRQADGNVPRSTNTLVLQALEQLAIHHAEHAQVLQSRYLDHEKVEQGANRLNMSVATFHRKRSEALPLLAAIVLEMEETAYQRYCTEQAGRLEAPTYNEVLGQDAVIAGLMELCLAPQAPWIIAITGIGGIGKTSLADRLVRHLIRTAYFAEIGWVTARQSIFNAGGAITPLPHPALTTQNFVEALGVQLWGEAQRSVTQSEEATLHRIEEQVKSASHLIVIDNLETMVDLETLLPLLRRLANPSKILLTTRESLFAQPDIYHCTVAELSAVDAVALLRLEARIRHVPQITAAPDEALLPIYQITGGNPLALRLVAGQLRIHPLATVLHELTMASGQQAETLYSYIYRHSWELLDEQEREVLIAMPLVSEQGGQVELITATCALPTTTVHQALDKLITLNLVNVTGDLHTRRYTIHGLTRSFLHQQVIYWQIDEDGSHDDQ